MQKLKEWPEGVEYMISVYSVSPWNRRPNCMFDIVIWTKYRLACYSDITSIIAHLKALLSFKKKFSTLISYISRDKIRYLSIIPVILGH